MRWKKPEDISKRIKKGTINLTKAVSVKLRILNKDG